ncbi:MAG: DUF5615 family PIN-like protein [Dehalococcoidia bacterium]
MNVLLDQNMPLAAAALLRARGCAATHTAEIDLARAPDELVMVHAVETGACIVTLDGDFHQMLALTGAAAPSVIRIRERPLNRFLARDVIMEVTSRFEAELASGAAITVHRGITRVRLLPLLDPNGGA